MEHIDALEAVRRLTLERDALLSVVVERDALAEQVRRLEEQAAIRIKERDNAVQRANHAENALQAPERRERPETEQTCERCKHAVPGAHAMLCIRHSPNSTGQHGERGHWPVVLMTDRCGDWEGK